MIQRYLLFILFLCLQLAARGQTGFTYRYWFDTHAQNATEGTSQEPTWHIDAALDGLDESLHVFHVQVQDSEGEWSVPVSRYFIKMTVESETNLTYWFDEDDAHRQTMAAGDGAVEVDVTALPDGMHVMHTQVSTQDNPASSAPGTYIFVKTPQTLGVDHMTCLVTIDGELYRKEQVAIADGVIAWKLDVAALPQGLHRYQVQVVTPSGAGSTMKEGFFVRAATSEEINAMKCFFMVDSNPLAVQEATTVTDGVFHFDLDVADIPNGLHRLSYWLSSGTSSTKVTTTFFTKIPLGGNGIVRYEYWLNDGFDQRTAVVVDPRQEVLTLKALLPVETQPIRSANFAFRMVGEEPAIYARNDFHIRFHDASGLFTDSTRYYVDEQVHELVEPVGEIQPSQNFKKVGENQIRWYTVTVEEGDTVAFRTTQACTLQLFSAAGDELYKASGSASVAYGGCHTWETGIYYLAVHDVTGASSSMNLYYMHMNKFDVVAQDVSTVGNGGCSTITYSGNGFRSLVGVDLYNAANDYTIHHEYIGHESDAFTSVVFDFTDAPLGKYYPIFHFAGDDDDSEDKPFEQLLTTVETAQSIEIATTVTYPGAFLRGRSTTFTVKLENKGNMTAYGVPIYAYIMNEAELDAITKVEIEGLTLKGLLEDVDTQEYTEQDMAELTALREELRRTYGDDHYFMHFHVPNEQGDSVWVRSNYFFTTLAPHETKTITFTVYSSESVYAYFTVPEEWHTVTAANFEENIDPSAPPRASFDYCCIRDGVDCFLSIASNVTAFAATISAVCGLPAAPALGIASCIVDIVKNAAKAIGSTVCDDKNKKKNFWDNLSSFMDNFTLGGTILNCLANALPIGKIKEILSGASNIVGGAALTTGRPFDLVNCFKNITTPTPGCPPEPPKGGKSEGRNSLDPNDIYGYLSEAGSKFIPQSAQHLNYTIEFENEPEFATASAHTVVVKDQLDKNLFDLASFKPTGVKIGNQKVDLNVNGQNFVTTFDMRPSIDAIAQVEGTFNASTGLATWTFTSLDPMTMEETDDVMQGFLPVNADGISGIGQVMFDIDLKQTFADGKEIPNQADIIFDANAVIKTPVWTNTVDAVAPTSYVSACDIKNDTTATLTFESADNRSKVWKYDVYVQYEEGASWLKAAEGVTTPQCDVRIYEGINHGFYVVATDSAGNVETKEAAREYTLDLFEPTDDSDLVLTLAKGWNWMSHNLNVSLDVSTVKAAALRILGQEEETMKDVAFGFVGDLTELKPAQGYKIEMEEADEIGLNGKLFNVSFKSIGLAEGWNWIGYPLAHTMTIAQALEHFTPEEGDYIVGQSGFAQYADGEWLGTITTLNPGKGYLYKSGSRKQMFFNSTATLSSRVEAKARRIADQNPWICDMYRYPNVMPVTASLYSKGVAEEADDYFVAAFCGNECRGVGKTVKGLVMMSVYGEGGETITFKVIDKETDQLLDVAESVAFSGDVLGTFSEPYRLTIGGEATGVIDLAANAMKITPSVIRDKMTVTVGSERINRLTVVSAGGAVVGDWKKLPDGSTVDVSGLSAGVYVVTAKVGKQVFTKKVMKVAE